MKAVKTQCIRYKYIPSCAFTVQCHKLIQSFATITTVILPVLSAPPLPVLSPATTPHVIAGDNTGNGVLTFYIKTAKQPFFLKACILYTITYQKIAIHIRRLLQDILFSTGH